MIVKIAHVSEIGAASTAAHRRVVVVKAAYTNAIEAAHTNTIKAAYTKAIKTMHMNAVEAVAAAATVLRRLSL